jgi:ATP-dependent Clp protease adapter protein ClpS
MAKLALLNLAAFELARRRIAERNITLPNDEQIMAGNYSVRVFNSPRHSDIYVMQLLSTLFRTQPNKAAEIALKIHDSGDEGVTIFTGSRDNCRNLMRALAAWGGDAAANLALRIDNDKGLYAEMTDNRSGEIVQRSGDEDEGADDAAPQLAPAVAPPVRPLDAVFARLLGN